MRHPTGQSRTRLLVSVRNADEARTALDGGADIIDIKEPSHGSLGMAETHVIRDVIATVSGRIAVSAALGELSDFRPVAALPDGLAFAKIGLAHAPHDWRELVDRIFRAASNITPIAAAYADHDAAHAPSPEDVLNWAITQHMQGLLIDTFHKDSRCLFDHLSPARLHDLIHHAHAHNIFIALAGSLTPAHIPQALSLAADIIAVRGAACDQNNRTARIEISRVKMLVALIAEHNAATAAGVD